MMCPLRVNLTVLWRPESYLSILGLIVKTDVRKHNMKLHLDTDIGGDLDDLCALALLLKTPDLAITGVTTTAETNGRRAGYVQCGWNKGKSSRKSMLRHLGNFG